MARLENKIPPPILWVLASALTFLVDLADLDRSPLESVVADWLGIAVAIAGVALGVMGIRRFATAGTTVDPHHLDDPSTLVVGGIYRFTRNPMYLGFVLLSIAWALRLGTVVGMIVGTGALITALTVLQIIPEERALTEAFGPDYERYRSQVRRWL